jgi:hypothetical protein
MHPQPSGRGGVERFARAALQVHGDGTPCTRHVISNVIMEIEGDAMAARAEAYYTVFQALPDFPLQPIACGRYRDTFVRRDDRWIYKEKIVRTGLMGDLSRHRR